MSNTALWDTVFMTDPKAVKPITGKSYQGNSPKPYWLIQQATKTFGPIGIGWGVTVKNERFERMSETDVLHVATVSVWYIWDGKRSESFDQMGGTKAAYKTSKGAMMVDEDAGKKSVTDGMVKCLSMIGFAGDIFSGRWDDSKYVAEANAEFRRQEQEAASPGMADDIRADWVRFINESLNAGDMKKRLAQAIEAAMEVNDSGAVDLFNSTAEAKAATARAKTKEAA